MNRQTPSNRSGIIIFATLAVIMIALVAMWFAFKYPPPKSTETTTTAPSQTKATPEIKSDNDLKELEDEVRNVDIDSLGEDLNLNDKDASEF